MQTHAVSSSFSSSESWSILSEIERSIKEKIEAVGTPLKDWDIQINYGIKTGFNDAFIIDSVKRNEILSACQTEEERQRTAEIIRPILRGRDIRRYGYNWADLWLINTHNGIRGEMERIHIEDYPAIKQHLDNYWNKIEPRADQGETAYNLRNCAYLDEFSKTKIVWIELSDESKFAICDDLVPLNTVFFLTGEHLHHILGMLNSKLLHWYFTTCLGTSSGVGTNRWLKYTIEQLPLVPYTDDTLSQLVIERLSPETEIDKCEERIDSLICELYGLSLDEMSFLNDRYSYGLYSLNADKQITSSRSGRPIQKIVPHRGVQYAAEILNVITCRKASAIKAKESFFVIREPYNGAYPFPDYFWSRKFVPITDAILCFKPFIVCFLASFDLLTIYDVFFTGLL